MTGMVDGLLAPLRRPREDLTVPPTVVDDLSIEVVVVGDHPVVRGGIVAMLAAEDDIEVVGEAANGRDAIELVLLRRPAAVLMDLRMPDLDGVGAIETIRAEWPEAPIVVLTTYGTDEAIVRAIEAGATGYLLDDAPPDDLIDAVRRTASGETVLADPVAKRLVDRVRDPEAGALSLRELEVLREVAAGHTNAVIANHLHISQAT